jgi:hypothetical protein
MKNRKLLSLWLLSVLLSACPPALLPAQDGGSFPPRDSLERLGVLIEKLRLQNKTQAEQFQILLELSNSSTEQLEGLRKSFDLSEQELSLLRSVSESQGSYINDLSKQIEELTRISTRQSQLLKASLLKNNILSVSIFVAVPAAFILGMLAAGR